MTWASSMLSVAGTYAVFAMIAAIFGPLTVQSLLACALIALLGAAVTWCGVMIRRGCAASGGTR